MSRPSNVARQIDERYWSRLMPKAERSSNWLDKAARDLEQAAKAWKTPFTVDYDGIRSKLEDAVVLAVFENDDRVVGFISASEPETFSRTALRALYIEGTIVHPEDGGRGKFGRLMDVIGEPVELLVLHTQSVHMMRAVGNRSDVLFPTPKLDRALSDPLAADLADWMLRIRTPKSAAFCPTTGIVEDLYDDRLYAAWPLPGNEEVASFRRLPRKQSGVLVVGFDSNWAAARWLVDSHTREAR
jgi:hypothetical protein